MFKLLALPLALLLPTMLHAAGPEAVEPDPEHELGVAYAPAGGPYGGLTSQSGNTTLVFSGSYAYATDRLLQFGASLHYVSFGGLQNLRPMFEVTMNLRAEDESLRDAFFLKAGGGVLIASSGSASAMFGVFGGSLGKRFRITESVSFKPNLFFSKVEGNSVRWGASPLEIALFL
ncbi:MAG: hypothetical protein IT285_01250 [Bdellovibrionales bacterium]|nr:hypothetical protein [Bdellovibrionales bacterium]